MNLVLVVSGGHDEESEDEGETGGVVSDQLGQVGGQQPGDLAPLDPEEDDISWWESRDCHDIVLAEVYRRRRILSCLPFRRTDGS